MHNASRRARAEPPWLDKHAGDAYLATRDVEAPPRHVLHPRWHVRPAVSGGTSGPTSPVARPARRPRWRVRPSRVARRLRLDRGGVEPGGGAQRGRLVGPLPREVVVLPPEVTVRRGLLIDRAVQTEVLPERARPQIEVLADQLEDLRPRRSSRCRTSRSSPTPDARPRSRRRPEARARSARPAATTFLATYRAA